VLQQTQQPVVTDPATAAASLYTVNMSTTLTNHSGIFNATAFSQAVVSVIVNPSITDVTGIDVVITAPNYAATRRLQNTATAKSDVTVSYQIQHINGESTAKDVQKQLESSSGSASLVNSYKTLSAVKTVSSATTTTTGNPISETRNNPVPPKPTAATPITGIIAGVVVGVIAALLLLTAWCKRDTLRAKYSHRQQQSTTQLSHALPDHESGLLNSTNSFLNANSGSNSNNGMSVFSSSGGGGNSNNVESFNFPIRRKPSASAQVLEETQSPIQQQLMSQQSTGMIAGIALADSTDVNETTSNDDRLVGNALKGSSKQHTPAAIFTSDAITSASTATTVAGTSTSTAAVNDSIGSTSTDLVPTESQSYNSQQLIAPIATTTTTATAVGIAAMGTAAADTTAASTAVVRKSKLPLRAGKLAQGFTASIASVLKQGVRDHGSKVEVAFEAVGAVAEHIPYVCHAWGLCNEVILLFSANAHISSNCAEVVLWAQQMQVGITLHYTTLYCTAAISYVNVCAVLLSFMLLAMSVRGD
jgi:hypothetical protein